MFKKIKKIFSDIKLAFLDKKNYKQFVTDIENEIKDPKSYFNQYRLILNENKDKITCILNIPENYAFQKDDRIINMKITELIQPITHYLSYSLGWAEYLYVPQVYHIEDDDPTAGESLTYVAVWQWAPIKGKTFLYKVFGITAGVLLAIIAGIILI